MDTFVSFTNSLPEDIKRKIAGFKINKQIKILKNSGIEIPENLLIEIEMNKKAIYSHKSVIASMEPFHGNKLEDFGFKI